MLRRSREKQNVAVLLNEEIERRRFSFEEFCLLLFPPFLCTRSFFGTVLLLECRNPNWSGYCRRRFLPELGISQVHVLRVRKADRSPCVYCKQNDRNQFRRRQRN